MDKKAFGAVIATGLLNEGVIDYIKQGKKAYDNEIKSDKSANTIATKISGAIGTGLGKVYSVARKGAVPLVASGLEKTGEKIANAGRNAAEGLAKRTIGFGHKVFYTGQNLRNKYKK